MVRHCVRAHLGRRHSRVIWEMVDRFHDEGLRFGVELDVCKVLFVITALDVSMRVHRRPRELVQVRERSVHPLALFHHLRRYAGWNGLLVLIDRFLNCFNVLHAGYE